jgi:tRNA dimethylallyltransferase
MLFVFYKNPYFPYILYLMEEMSTKQTKLLIMGCTASGKSKLAFELARRLQGEILSIDSMKVYRRMDIGTAKPSPAAREAIRHHLMDIVEPSESFSLGRYVELADEAIRQMEEADIPIIAAGGTAMYIRGLLEGVFDGPPADPELREKLNREAQNETLESLHKRLAGVDPVTAQRVHPNDQKRIIRALEVYELTGKPISSFQQQFRSGNYRHDWKLIYLYRDKEEGNHRINMRVKRMIEEGLVEEVKSLLSEPAGLSPQASQAVGYAEIIEYLRRKCKLDEAIEKIKINTRRFAKSQRTWFRSFTGINRFDVGQEVDVTSLAERIMKHFNLR